MKGTLPRAAVRTILAPTDLTPASLPGVVEATELAQRLAANLILMTAIPKPRAVDGVHGRYLDQATDAARMRLASWFTRKVPLEARQGVSVRFLAVSGPIAEEILEVASTEGADLIVMTTHGRSGLRRLLHGSVAESVVRASPSPVLTIRADGMAARRAAAA